MPSAIVWPATLPCFRFEPYNVAPRPGAVEMTLGMVTRRARVYTENNELVSVEMIMSSAQEQTLRTFFKTTTSMGTQSFLVELLMAGTLEDREATFYGAPPSFVPVAPGYVRATFQLLARRTPATVTYELFATDYVNIDATTFSSSGSIGGTIATVNTLSTDRIVITKPSIDDDDDLEWDAWSNHDSNGDAGGFVWLNNFSVSDQDDVLIEAVSTGALNSIAGALAAAQGLMPIQLTGSTQYQFWGFDVDPTDNRRGLSLKVETYRPGITP